MADLIGEAFIVDASRKLTPAEQGEAVARSYRRSPEATAATVIHTAQDFAEGEDDPATLRWLDGLAERCETIADLLLLADAFPKESLVLRDRAATVTAVVANRLRSAAQPGSDPASLAARAVVLSNLSVRLSELGRHEQALLAREESVAICRELPMTHLGALLPSSLNNLATRWAHSVVTKRRSQRPRKRLRSIARWQPDVPTPSARSWLLCLPM